MKSDESCLLARSVCTVSSGNRCSKFNHRIVAHKGRLRRVLLLDSFKAIDAYPLPSSMLSAESREALIITAIQGTETSTPGLRLKLAVLTTTPRNASQAREYAYFPHSNFRVGAALMCTDGTIVKGASIDNASYSVYSSIPSSSVVQCVASLLPTHLHTMFLNAALRRCVDMRGTDGNRERYCKHLLSLSPIGSLTLLTQSPRPLAVRVHPITERR